uniref:NAD(P)-binding domain-containing protein n=1 Tax=Pseudo-nitzschia australis TaxID=44445 RepID=A0A7S4AXL2_9STRA|mmetsp:Transcript_1155/g.2343  ORF Transcript_1155/g.2343 Transcript_1155/m.2343 type:complete len:213 (+) Transcript_1155:125-763(+)|eukprot:CAMPEP_0168182824 /NCGR_PEP_ID=MMETSP0139_2-20121125/12098_1 /TAXON_ID=44445 /ORGANISM="Pseudo-nitzschia australis, Strain 10249 10 AB" /LENGTH=212 /DNA_ID=CAMNT_0008103777 /DNA_START=64 /DNA_END=702 /DNA_ORIENTATION=+
MPNNIFSASCQFVIALALATLSICDGLQIAIAGGTGNLGRLLLPKLVDHDVTVLTRNSFLASAPNKVTEVFGYLGKGFLKKHPHVTLRDWDGGDLLDIVGSDFLGWQEDALKNADVVVHMCGGYTEQREMATERLIRESFQFNKGAVHIAINPIEEEIPYISPGMVTVKTKRIQKCEDMVRENCSNSRCLRLEAFKREEACEEIFKTIQSLV